MATQLPLRPETRGKITEGFCTPKEDKSPQRAVVPPERVLPIVFLPGIMGSNLRMSSERQTLLKKKNNIAWRPDRTKEALKFLRAGPAARQLQLDPQATEVDTYEGGNAQTGDGSESADDRHNNGDINVNLYLGIETPLLFDDPVTAKPRRTKEEKARARGWGEIYFSSYREILETCESRLNCTVAGWEHIVGKSPSDWQVHGQPALKPVTEEELHNTTQGCWFPVHAMGYNWLKSCKTAATDLAPRILNLIAEYKRQGYQCEKVVIVTHSMGGLVARALIHPKMGKISGRILGIVHGVMPAIGSPAAYKRMRSGFEEGPAGVSIPAMVLGNHGDEVTAVLANSAGGLELLPSTAYGNGWLRVRHNGQLIGRFPKNGDPYEEIYKLRGTWYGLLREEWINPAAQEGRNFDRTCGLLDDARQFHKDIESSYHPNSHAHYGADSGRPSWEYMTWEIKTRGNVLWDWDNNFAIEEDSKKGKLLLRAKTPDERNHIRRYPVQLGDSVGAGDETVPVRSADHQLRSGVFRTIFRQCGYEHQGSYSNEKAVNATLFSLIRIIQSMNWDEKTC